MTVAGQLAAADSGIVTAASFSTEDAPASQVEVQRNLKDKADEWLAADGLEANSIFRVSRSIAAGLLQVVRGEKATLVLTEWHFEGLDRESEAGQMLARSPVPVLLVRGAIEPFGRVAVLARREDVIGSELHDLHIAAQLAARVAHGRRVGYVGPAPDTVAPLFPAKMAAAVERIENNDALGWAQTSATENDLLMFCGIDAARAAMERFPGLDHKRFLVAVAAYGDGAGAHDRVVGWAVDSSVSTPPAT